ncbi:citrate lyase subunit beta/citryl-CoA lyase/(S)-citramalyl-CoA lyase [Blastomonas natatoria]|uniref:Citrate lyase subunit beta/citryl-CoA lyase/(S)-citramalyl-CoA lyase n=1 Tax=Blastomonas natatoria TaxID=34015 RepID=A0A2V3V447_9SPHN|nr:CoA ester lyase [Blastomonas natatoria]PXW76260.1 citrate lyase subunit beta/citryl-CoA lyase/(S)-citramalyl-CoA lyase [Blastomonas natatoria]
MFAASSILFVPGSRVDRIAKALGSAADLVCIDLEDAVAATDKDSAREAVMAGLGSWDRPRIAVRINGLMTRAGLRDLIALTECATPPPLLFVPMVEQASEMAQVARILDNPAIGLVPLIETVKGLRNAHLVAAQPQVAAMMFGGGDFSAQLGVDLAFDPLLVARGQFIMACADAGVPAIDVPFVKLDDAEGLADECRRVRALGFAAKAAIHPAQVDAINTSFGADAEALAEAHEAIAAYEAAGGMAIRHKGKMLEAPIVARMRAMLSREAKRNERTMMNA